MREGMSQRDREEAASAIKQRYIDGDITAVQMRADLARVGWNATQIGEFVREAMQAVVSIVKDKGWRGAFNND